MTRFVCDRCGAVEGELGVKDWKHLSIYDMSGMLGRGNYDLCPKCADKFNRFMKCDAEPLRKEVWSEIPDWAERVLNAYCGPFTSIKWMSDGKRLFTPEQVKKAFQVTLGVYDEAR